jgi:hypothetical protein
MSLLVLGLGKEAWVEDDETVPPVPPVPPVPMVPTAPTVATVGV